MVRKRSHQKAISIQRLADNQIYNVVNIQTILTGYSLRTLCDINVWN